MPELENSLPIQPGDIVPPQAGTSFLKKLKTKWLIVLGALGSIALFAAIIYAAYSYGKRGQEPQPTPITSSLLSPTLAVTPLITPTLSPTNISPTLTVSSQGKIAFLRDDDIWIINADGTEEKKVTNTGGKIYTYDWGQDGQNLYFSYKVVLTNTNRDELIIGNGLIELNLSSLQQRELIPPKTITDLNNKEFLYTHPDDIAVIRVSPSGKKIALSKNGIVIYDLTTNELEEGVKLAATNPSGYKRSRFTPEANAAVSADYYKDIVWSADESSLLLTKAHYEGRSNELLNLSTRELTDLGFTYIGGGSVYFDFVDTNLLVGQNVRSDQSFKLFVENVNESKKDIFFETTTPVHWYQSPQYSSKYQGLFFTTENDEPQEEGGDAVILKRSSIYLVNTETGKYRLITSHSPAEVRDVIDGIKSSSDQEHLVYILYSRRENNNANAWVFKRGSLWVVNQDGSGKKLLTTNASQPAWNPK